MRVEVLRVARKLKDVRQDLAPLEKQGNVKDFYNNVKNADKLSGLIEDIRDAMLEYQVSIYLSLAHLTSAPDFVTAEIGRAHV